MICLCNQTFMVAEVIGVARVVQFLGEFLARVQAAVEIESLHQIDDGGSPCKLQAAPLAPRYFTPGKPTRQSRDHASVRVAAWRLPSLIIDGLRV